MQPSNHRLVFQGMNRGARYKRSGDRGASVDYDWQIRQYRTPLRRYMTDSNACDYSPGIFEIFQLKSDQASRSAGARHSWLIGLCLLELYIFLGDDTITVLCNGNGIRIGFVRIEFCLRLTSSTVDLRL
jgi:hypothetical protein